MRTSPIWTVPLLLLLLGIVMWVGAFTPVLKAVIAVEIIGLAIYLLMRNRRGYPQGEPISNLTMLLPGHMLILLAAIFAGAPERVAVLWTLIPAATLAYDLVTVVARNTRCGRSILIGLYGILWADVFYLLQRVISHGRGFTAGEETIAVLAFGIGGAAFVLLGGFRHWRMNKE